MPREELRGYTEGWVPVLPLGVEERQGTIQAHHRPQGRQSARHGPPSAVDLRRRGPPGFLSVGLRHRGSRAVQAALRCPQGAEAADLSSPEGCRLLAPLVLWPRCPFPAPVADAEIWRRITDAEGDFQSHPKLLWHPAQTPGDTQKAALTTLVGHVRAM